jgi:hypothetical protein
MGEYSIPLEEKNLEDEFVITNYWMEIHLGISKILKELSGLVIITHNSIEFVDILEILNKIRPDTPLKILYISLTRSYDYMCLELKRNKLKNKEMTFIDCVSQYAFIKENELEDCYYHDPPLNLDEMKEIILFGIKKYNPDVVVLDSLSQFINFSRPTDSEISSFYKFLLFIKSNSLNAMQDTFILLYDNKLGMMQNLPKIHTDLILKVEILKERIDWWREKKE